MENLIFEDVSIQVLEDLGLILLATLLKQLQHIIEPTHVVRMSMSEQNFRNIYSLQGLLFRVLYCSLLLYCLSMLDLEILYVLINIIEEALIVGC